MRTHGPGPRWSRLQAAGGACPAIGIAWAGLAATLLWYAVRARDIHSSMYTVTVNRFWSSSVDFSLPRVRYQRSKVSGVTSQPARCVRDRAAAIAPSKARSSSAMAGRCSVGAGL